MSKELQASANNLTTMDDFWDILETRHEPFANKSPTITA